MNTGELAKAIVNPEHWRTNGELTPAEHLVMLAMLNDETLRFFVSLRKRQVYILEFQLLVSAKEQWEWVANGGDEGDAISGILQSQMRVAALRIKQANADIRAATTVQSARRVSERRCADLFALHSEMERLADEILEEEEDF